MTPPSSGADALLHRHGLAFGIASQALPCASTETTVSGTTRTAAFDPSVAALDGLDCCPRRHVQDMSGGLDSWLWIQSNVNWRHFESA